MTNEELKEEFALKFSNWKLHHKSVPCIKDDFVVNEIADWWLERFDLYKKELVLKLPNEKIHQLPDTVGSPHETEHDRGWNDYRKEVISIINEK